MRTWKYAVALLAATAAGLAGASVSAQQASAVRPAQQPWLDRSLSAEKRADLLLRQMTLDEKIALLHGRMAIPFGPEPQVPEGAIGSAGYIAGNPRLGLPALQESDASLGVTNPFLVRGAEDMSTALPASLGLAATFNPALAYEGGRMIGVEARAKGINVQLAGGANLARDPRNGRNFEYLGEDPLLAGVLAGDSVKGIQSMGLISTVKHFALNGQEHNRTAADSVIGDEAARESDLLAFQIAIERGDPGSVMCAYNLVNGAYACQHPWLLNTVLKKDWGYKGFVMSDWGAVHSLEAIIHGLDQQSGEQLDERVWFGQPLKDAVAAGLPQYGARVDDAASRILRAMFAGGLFDQTAATAAKEIDFEAHAQIAQHQAEEAIVLLQNRSGLLPLAKGVKRIAVIGGHADAGVPSGGGSSQVTNPWRAEGTSVRVVPFGGEGMMAAWNNVVFHPSSPLAALRAAFSGSQVTFDNGLYHSAAVAQASAADVAIVFAYQPSSEGFDVPDMSLPFGQDALIEGVAAANPNTIVVLQTGNPVKMPWAERVGAVMQAWYGGSRGGEAIARVIAGEVNPSGRLPISWPVDESQLPRPTIPGLDSAPDAVFPVDYNIEGSDVGYRWFAREGIEPRYWFGHGLSYTGFGYSDLQVSGGETISAEVTVRNTGSQTGKDVVQLYLTGSPGGPMRRLLGFQKVELQPGESRRVTFTADPRLIAEYDAGVRAWRIDPGGYNVAIGPDAHTTALAGSAVLKRGRLKP